VLAKPPQAQGVGAEAHRTPKLAPRITDANTTKASVSQKRYNFYHFLTH
jgi:hypothetical protein